MKVLFFVFRIIFLHFKNETEIEMMMMMVLAPALAHLHSTAHTLLLWVLAELSPISLTPSTVQPKKMMLGSESALTQNIPVKCYACSHFEQVSLCNKK